MKTITLEEHFVTTAFPETAKRYPLASLPQPERLQSQLLDLGAGRIAAMDKGRIDPSFA